MYRCAVVIALITAPASAQEIFQQKLISASGNVHLGSTTFHGKNVPASGAMPWSVTLKRLKGGKQEGVDIIVVDNGKLKITLVSTRGLGILSAQLGDVRLGWDSPVREVVHPKFINLQSRGGLGWLEGFNEWMCRCGLENNGQPGPDRFINNVGDEATMELTLHGKIANIPAQEVELIIDGDRAKPRITIRGRVDEKMVFGPKLELHTEVSTVVGADTFRIADVVVNAGAQPQEFQMLYHANFGKPLLERGARFLAPLAKVTPFNQRAAKDLDTYHSYLGPTPGYIEQVYLLQPLADDSGKTVVMLHNQKADRGASMMYSLKELPYLTVWKNTGAEEDGYVTGLEPGTNYPNRRAVERKAGRVPKLAPGGRYAMTLDISIHADAAAVQAVVDRIATIQGKTKIGLEKTPAN